MAYAASSFSISIQVTSSSSSEMNIIKASFSNPNLSVLRHKVTWSVGDYSYQSPYTNVGAKSASYTIPDEWYSEAPDSETMTVRVSVETYSGSSKQGSTAAKTCTINVPFQFYPTSPTVTTAITNESINFPGEYIQGITGTTITLTGATGRGGATIEKYGFIVYDSRYISIANQEKSSNQYTINRINSAGTIYVKGYVVDSRGRMGPYREVSFSSNAYTTPSISAISAARCDMDGTPNESGTYAMIVCSANHTETIGQYNNTITINSVYYPTNTPSQRTVAQYNMVSGQEYIVGSGNLDPDLSYTFEFGVTDIVGSSAIETAELDTTPYSIHVKNGGRGVAFGKASEIDYAVEINDDWDLYYKGKKIDVFEVTTPLFGSLPVTFYCDRITANHELFQDGYAFISNRQSIKEDLTITTFNGGFTISGAAPSAFTAVYIKALMCDKQKETATRGSN